MQLDSALLHLLRLSAPTHASSCQHGEGEKQRHHAAHDADLDGDAHDKRYIRSCAARSAASRRCYRLSSRRAPETRPGPPVVTFRRRGVHDRCYDQESEKMSTIQQINPANTQTNISSNVLCSMGLNMLVAAGGSGCGRAWFNIVSKTFSDFCCIVVLPMAPDKTDDFYAIARMHPLGRHAQTIRCQEPPTCMGKAKRQAAWPGAGGALSYVMAQQPPSASSEMAARFVVCSAWGSNRPAAPCATRPARTRPYAARDPHNRHR